MNKLKKLQKQVIQALIKAIATIIAAAALYFGADTIKESEQQSKLEAQGKLAQDKALMDNLQSQITRSATAERQFVDVSANHLNAEYAANSEELKTWLRNAKNQYRLSNEFRLSITPQKPTDKGELTGLAYDITIRPSMKLEFRAISDTHVFSFVQDFVRQAPGIIRIDSINLNRTGEIDESTLNQMNNGQAIYLADAVINFSWIGIAPKETRTDAAGAKEPGK